ncbi:hypothetical protein N658DRAFT_493965 [Parathielavia hyrcaniae]|uniref:Pyridoxamine 5'-phosphate oxidase Alr4036 family FMN-binding domain-containing protein n=1 Tax=Parathielavia hyrcaniae TaxID=113614 RepID=A0AAN6T478_9PEZI|nr:hypothetical protein N658DRAFT_493965 [Parathielavia hyrcaniae]
MSTTTTSQAPAPWREDFLSHTSQMPSPTFTLATLHPATLPEAPSRALPCVPRARTCVLRGLWATLPENPHNPAPPNPRLFESDLPVFTTDARSDKATEVFDSAAAGDVEASGGLTGGGGPVEAVFWVDLPGVKTQWRVRGHAWVLAGEDADSIDRDGARKMREVLRGRMRRTAAAGEGGDEEEGSWSFAREVKAHFGNLSPMMRGSFKAPPPGAPVAYHTGKGEGVGQRLDNLDDAVAGQNFRVVVIVPDEVDQVDLSDEMRPRRWLHVYRGLEGDSRIPGGEAIGEWEKVEVWP